MKKSLMLDWNPHAMWARGELWLIKQEALRRIAFMRWLWNISTDHDLIWRIELLERLVSTIDDACDGQPTMLLGDSQGRTT